MVAPADGTLEKILHQTGDTVKGEQVIGLFKAGAIEAAPAQATAAPVATPATPASSTSTAPAAGPAVRRMMGENDVAPESVTGTGKSGRITRDDVSKAMTPATAVSSEMAAMGSRAEKRVPMTRLRARIAERLIQSQQTAAILTTFNEVNMKPVMDLRAKYKDAFEKRHGVKLGFMSFFTRAVVEALKRFPIVNSSIDGNDIVYHGYMDIGIAVSSPRGLVVPIIRNAETLSMAEIEQKIAEYGKKAQAGQLGIEDMTGGTFTISNGGVFGSLMSTPIINPPQTGILGMHKIEERPVVENGQIVIRPMMYLAMSYDHRLIDGSESVRFLVTIKEMLEDPARLVLEV